MASLHIIRTHHGDYEARDAGGLVAQIWLGRDAGSWWIAANYARFPTHSDLPAVFGGLYTHPAARFGDVFRLFGLPLPGAAAIAIADAARGAAPYSIAAE